MRGILMFAHNNGLFDYGKMAYVSAVTAKHYLDVPITLVTDQETWDNLNESTPAEHLFESSILIERGEIINHRNFNLDAGTVTRAAYYNISRLRAYELSPYDETLLLDTDVLIQDTSLNGVWGSTAFIRMNQEISELVKTRQVDNTVMKLGENSMSVFWATICYFRKCQETKEFFTLMKYVVDNYEYFGSIYGFPTEILRVDFVMTIAAHIMSGYIHESHSVISSLPDKDTVFAWNRDIMVSVKKGSSTFVINSGGQTFPITTYRTVHCMNKDSMMNMADRIIECYE